VSAPEHILTDGFHLSRGVFGAPEVSGLINLLDRNAPTDSPHALRNLLERVPGLCSLTASGKVAEEVAVILGGQALCVRAILFDKTPEANWKVAFHQDRSIAVRRRIDLPGFGPWSVKAGVPHVQPPLQILESMLTARIHLDDCGPDNAPLRVSRASHNLGLLDAVAIGKLRQNSTSVLAQAGDVLYMRPLLLHASSAARSPSRRRVIHLEFAAVALPEDLEWHLGNG
jgi:ectoine hydroxylase-related dioxygenase (phytanoyl-CoA dioxygenase family)